MNSIHGPQWERDEEYRQSVIRKAQLLGFGCEEYKEYTRSINGLIRYRFTIEGVEYSGYATIYSAAYGFLRLQGLSHLAGVYNG